MDLRLDQQPHAACYEKGGSSVIEDVCILLPEEADLLERLEQRLGRVHAQQRLAMERDCEDCFSGRINFWRSSSHRGLRNTESYRPPVYRGSFGLKIEWLSIRKHIVGATPAVALQDLMPEFAVGFSV
jgi:hypothetical protein